MSLINHEPCTSNAEIDTRLAEDHSYIGRLASQGHPLMTIVSYHSDQTLETHALPVFETDSLEDLANRYYDFFPKECNLFFRQLEERRAAFNKESGVGDQGLMGFHCSIPQCLWVLMKARFPEAVSDPDGFRRLTKSLLQKVPRLRGSRRYGS